MGKHRDGVRTPYGWRVYVRVHGVGYSKRFPADATLTERRDWRAGKRIAALAADLKAATAHPPPAPGSFAEDAQTYLAAVKAMPSYADRERDIKAWLTALGGTRPRDSISSAEIRTVLHRWRLKGKKRAPVPDGKTEADRTGLHPLSESACNHRRTALMHLFTVLNGRGGINPVKEVPKFREPDPEARGVDRPTLARIAAQMADSKTKARILIMGLTGLPHASLGRLTRASLDATAKTLSVPRRRKGAGTQARTLELTPEAVKAFKMLDRFDGWGPFSNSSLRKALRLACEKAGAPMMRGYDLRHSFATQLYAASGDIRAVQSVLDHSDQKLTHRYTMGAVDQRVTSALAAWRKSARKSPRTKKQA